MCVGRRDTTGRHTKWASGGVCLDCEREQQMDKLQVCEGGVGFHRWMTERKEQKEVVDGRRVRSGMQE